MRWLGLLCLREGQTTRAKRMAEHGLSPSAYTHTHTHTHTRTHTHHTHACAQIVTWPHTHPLHMHARTHARTHNGTYTTTQTLAQVRMYVRTHLPPFLLPFPLSARTAHWHSSVASSLGGIASQIEFEDVQWGGGVAGGGLCRQVVLGPQWPAHKGKGCVKGRG